MFITIDGGTTNTRLVLFNDKKEAVDKLKLNVGAGDGTETLKEAVRKGINTLSKGASVSAVIASGMIGSECGLAKIPHITAPVTKELLAKSLVKLKIDDVYNVPFYFIPGIKYVSDEGITDIMRGEEAEFFGLISAEKISGDIIGILPGSHNKIILSSNGMINKFYTSISGEAIAALSAYTILKKALPNGLSSEVSQEYLLKGFNTARNTGMCAALFKLRIMDNFSKLNDIEKSSYLCGVVLYDDIKLIKQHYSGQKILVGGSMPLKKEIGILIECEICQDVIYATEKNAEYASAYSALDIYLLSQNKLKGL